MRYRPLYHSDGLNYAFPSQVCFLENGSHCGNDRSSLRVNRRSNPPSNLLQHNCIRITLDPRQTFSTALIHKKYGKQCMDLTMVSECGVSSLHKRRTFAQLYTLGILHPWFEVTYCGMSAAGFCTCGVFLDTLCTGPAGTGPVLWADSSLSFSPRNSKFLADKRLCPAYLCLPDSSFCKHLLK